VLVLVPEIALITQTERRFRARFGEQVAVLHSALSQGERFDQWVRILRGEVPIAIGVRSAVFARFRHRGDYRRRGARCLLQTGGRPALQRPRPGGGQGAAGRSGGPAGSATPSLQSYHNVRSGKYTQLTLPQRIEARSLPAIRTVDLRQCRDLRGPGRFISAELNRAISETLGRGEQVLLFLNRRGFASFPVCAPAGRRCAAGTATFP